MFKRVFRPLITRSSRSLFTLNPTTRPLFASKTLFRTYSEEKKLNPEVIEMATALDVEPAKPQPVGKIEPRFRIQFTCKKCETRSEHEFTHKSYYEGVVITTCPGCKNHHLIADKLGYFDHFKDQTLQEAIEAARAKNENPKDPVRIL